MDIHRVFQTNKHIWGGHIMWDLYFWGSINYDMFFFQQALKPKELLEHQSKIPISNNTIHWTNVDALDYTPWPCFWFIIFYSPQ